MTVPNKVLRKREKSAKKKAPSSERAFVYSLYSVIKNIDFLLDSSFTDQESSV